MEAAKEKDDHMTSAAAFIEGGVQEACDDVCSICLEDFSQSNPSTVTNCKHEFHLQCILEWCQRSSSCPMCWQPISLKDATSQELLEAVEQERELRSNRSRNASLFQHPTLGNFELQHLPLGGSEAELEEHILQHLAAAAAMRRGHHMFRRDGPRNRPFSQANHPYFILPTPNAPPHGANVSSSASLVGGGSSISPILTDDVHRAGSNVASANLLAEIRFAGQSSPASEDTAGPSDLQSLSESLRSRFTTWSMRYKESISRNTRGWKERLFARSPSMADLSSEVNAGIASVSRMMERLDSQENNGTRLTSGSSDAPNISHMDDSENRVTPMRDNSKMSTSFATGSSSD